MKAAFLTKPNTVELRNTSVPEPKQGEVRVKLKMVGICGSDVHFFLGHRKLSEERILGHEGLGYIDKIGDDVEGRKIGERAVIEPNIPCMQCKYCLGGRSNICPNKRVIGLNREGCFAEYVIVPSEFCWSIPDSISDHDAVTIEPTAVGVHSLSISKSKPGDTIAVIGLGAIGLLLTHLAISLGYKVITVDTNVAKLKVAGGMGAFAISVKNKSAEAQIKNLSRLFDDHDVNSVFECAGVAAAVSVAIASAPRGSEVILAGLADELASFKPLRVVREGISIKPSLIYNHPSDFKNTIDLIVNKTIQPQFVISKFMPLTKIQKALDTASKGKESKIVITV
jgi:threonine dehydrogenase-like Zn-dependent dehydrogenase